MDGQLTQALDQAIERARRDGHIVIGVLWPEGESLRWSVGSVSTVVLERYNPHQRAAVLGAMVDRALVELTSVPRRAAPDAQGEAGDG